MNSVVATLENGLKMRIKRKNTTPCKSPTVEKSLKLDSVEEIESTAEIVNLCDSETRSKPKVKSNGPKSRKKSRKRSAQGLAKEKKSRVNSDSIIYDGNSVSEKKSNSAKEEETVEDECENDGNDDSDEVACGNMKNDSSCTRSKKESNVPSLSDKHVGNKEEEGIQDVDSDTEPVTKADVSKLMSADLNDDESEGRLCDANTETVHMGVMTDPDCLGPCEPGTSVVLEGIVWNESNNGILVVNVTWRGKTYVGTLMDSTKHHWAPPRFQEDSPACFTNHSWRNGSGLGISDSCKGRRLRKCRKDAIPGTSSKQAPIRQYQTLSQTSSSVESDSLSNSVDLQLSKCGSKTNTFIECTKPNCNKKYKHLAGLQYHQSHAHKKVEKTTDHSSTLVSRPSCDSSKIRPTLNSPSRNAEPDIGGQPNEVQSDEVKSSGMIHAKELLSFNKKKKIQTNQAVDGEELLKSSGVEGNGDDLKLFAPEKGFDDNKSEQIGASSDSGNADTSLTETSSDDNLRPENPCALFNQLSVNEKGYRSELIDQAAGNSLAVKDNQALQILEMDEKGETRNSENTDQSVVEAATNNSLSHKPASVLSTDTTVCNASDQNEVCTNKKELECFPGRSSSRTNDEFDRPPKLKPQIMSHSAGLKDTYNSTREQTDSYRDEPGRLPVANFVSEDKRDKMCKKNVESDKLVLPGLIKTEQLQQEISVLQQQGQGLQGQGQQQQGQMQQLNSSLHPTSYGYSIDPVYHMHMMSTNPGYRAQYKKWVLDRKQMSMDFMRSEHEDLKPVDMSSKKSEVLSNGREMLNHQLSNKTQNKLNLGFYSSKEYSSAFDLELKRKSPSCFSQNKEISQYSMTSSTDVFKRMSSEHGSYPSSDKGNPISRNFMPDHDKKYSQNIAKQDTSNSTQGYPNSYPVSRAHSLTSPGGQQQQQSDNRSFEFSRRSDFGNDMDILGQKYSASRSYNYDKKMSSDKLPQQHHGSHRGSSGLVSRSMLELDDLKQGKEKSNPREPYSSGNSNEGSQKKMPHGSPPAKHHLHTHHHTHVINAPYPIYGQYAASLLSTPAIVPAVVMPEIYTPK